MSEPSRFLMQVVGDIEQGDLWRVAKVEGDFATFERVRAEPGQFRGLQPDGLWPRLPPAGSRPISDEEARALADEMDRAMSEHGRQFRDAAREHNEQLARALQAELAAVEGPEPVPLHPGQDNGAGYEPGPFADLDCEEG